jgi:hypothetical protein
MDELNFGGRPFKKGAPKSLGVRRVQEWLWLHGFAVAIDNDFGDATEKAVKAFQRKHHLPATGIVDQKTHHALTQPMRNALKPIDPHGKTLRQLIVAYARQHIGQRPREIGGQNKGPWVRLYMDGHDGDPWLWCAGFAAYPIRQAAETLGKAMPVLRNFGVANIAHHAQQVGDFLLVPSSAARAKIKPGSLFLERGGPTGYLHCGIVRSHDGTTMETYAGNSNMGGSNNGYEALARTRGFTNMDFALV